MTEKDSKPKTKKRRTVQYDRWGYFFIAPFFLIYVVFSLIPLITTFTYSFLESYKIGTAQVGPNFHVPKYFSGQEKFYKPRMNNAEMALDELANCYKEDSKVSERPKLESEILNTVDEAAESIDIKKYSKTISKYIETGIKKDMTCREVIKLARAEISKDQWALLRNIKTVFASDDNVWKYFCNTLIMWILGFVPQILVSLLLAVWFTNTELRLKCQQFFKTVIYLPNLIMAAAFAMLFFSLFSDNGPVNGILKTFFSNPEEFQRIRFFSSTGWTRTIVALMNFLMWYGNTTILLMAGVMGIDNSIFEAARIDGASPLRIFFTITIPLLLPIFVYVLITSLIGGIQMFDVPQILTNGSGNPNKSIMTIIMKLNKHLQNKNYGPAGVTSVLVFAVTGVLSGIVYKTTMKQYQNKR